MLELLAVAAAGAAAGASNSLAGAGSLITFPTLVALGVPPLSANVTSTIGLVPGAAGGAIGYADLLGEQRGRVARLAIPTLIGAAVGSAPSWHGGSPATCCEWRSPLSAWPSPPCSPGARLVDGRGARVA